MTKKPNKHYVDNEKLLEAYKEYKKMIQAAEESGTEIPNPPKYISESILKIAKNLTYNHRFINYTWHEDMISDAVYDCTKSLHLFDPENYSHPFNYLTTICYWAFVRRLKAEKKQLLIKAKMIMDSSLHEINAMDFGDEEHIGMSNYRDFVQGLRLYDDILIQEENRQKTKKEKKTKKQPDIFED